MDDITPESSKKKNPEADLRKEFQKLQAENLRLKLRIQRVEGLLDLQKKAFELLGEMNRDDHKSEKN
jgi:hypothetical protein